jgi:hypothetical protein
MTTPANYAYAEMTIYYSDIAGKKNEGPNA